MSNNSCARVIGLGVMVVGMAGCPKPTPAPPEISLEKAGAKVFSSALPLQAMAWDGPELGKAFGGAERATLIGGSPTRGAIVVNAPTKPSGEPVRSPVWALRGVFSAPVSGTPTAVRVFDHGSCALFLPWISGAMDHDGRIAAAGSPSDLFPNIDAEIEAQFQGRNSGATSVSREYTAYQALFTRTPVWWTYEGTEPDKVAASAERQWPSNPAGHDVHRDGFMLSLHEKFHGWMGVPPVVVTGAKSLHVRASYAVTSTPQAVVVQANQVWVGGDLDDATEREVFETFRDAGARMTRSIAERLTISTPLVVDDAATCGAILPGHDAPRALEALAILLVGAGMPSPEAQALIREVHPEQIAALPRDGRYVCGYRPRLDHVNVLPRGLELVLAPFGTNPPAARVVSQLATGSPELTQLLRCARPDPDGLRRTDGRWRAEDTDATQVPIYAPPKA